MPNPELINDFLALSYPELGCLMPGAGELRGGDERVPAGNAGQMCHGSWAKAPQSLAVPAPGSHG